jgi:DNA-binding CsgD family transcriptional regulator/tetratricopeptide (TPR) repeat protein
MWPIRPPHWVGRKDELAVLTAAMAALARGEGTVVWVEGEPGIGKSSLVTEALAVAGEPGWDVGWGGADQLSGRLPLRVMQDCLRAHIGSPDPRRARAAALLRGWRHGALSGGDASADGIEVLLTLADELCASSPTVLVLDDLQWADEASLTVWHQLAASISQSRLLLIGTCRPASGRPELQQVRAAVARRGQVVALAPLPGTDVTALVASMVGAPPGDGLRRLTAQAAGNPLYVCELVDALLRERAVVISPVAEVATAGEHLPVSLGAVLEDRLNSVSAETAQLLRIAAVLGGRFAVSDVAVVLRQPAPDLVASLQEAVAAAILDGAGPELAFRHPLIRQALYESIPQALRTALHAEAARGLAAAGADALTVAQQLSAARRPATDWSRAWLLQAAPALATGASRLAVELLTSELGETPGGEGWDVLAVSLVRALLIVGDSSEAVGQAGRALAAMTDPARRCETSWLLAQAQVSAGLSNDVAVSTIKQALGAADVPRVWEARLLAGLGAMERVPDGVIVSRTFASQGLAVAEQVGDPTATAQALFALWLANSVERDHAAALDCVERALAVMGDDSGHDDLRSSFLDARTLTLQNLDEWQRAELALRQSREFAQRSGRADRATWASAAVLRYWLGDWDDALAELGTDATDAPRLVYAFHRERWSALLFYGVTALIAGRREQRTAAGQSLEEGLALPIEKLSDRENRDFLVAAHALSLEQAGDVNQAMLRLAEMLPRRGNEMTLIHQWLPDLARLALAAGNRSMARAAAEACQQEADAETRPARAAAASLRCHGLLEADVDRLTEAVAHYRAVGPAVELPTALEDLAVVFAEHGHEGDARAALNEAVNLYEGMQARWDIRRAESRLRPYGIRRGGRSRGGPRPTAGWEALTPTEVKVAALVARGDSTADIALSMFLSRRTVQTYISRILTKLDAKSRVEIVREALLRGVSP